ncbi:MAG: HAMP domain-containing histidine kinase [Eubacterium sp.]|nr:HAMP domain-containing histidine kinase [Eubacterium sp.]
MKELKGALILFIGLMAAALIVIFSARGRFDRKKRDISFYNDKLISMEKDYLAGTSIEELESRYGCDIVFSSSLVDAELSKYYGDYAMIVDFAPGGELIGKAVWNDYAEDHDSDTDVFFKTALIIWGVVLLCGILLVVILYFRMIKPVKELSRFSTEIARGNLDVPLPIRKSSISEGFTESFDLMREELKASREREAAMQKAKKEMVADLSHDIKTPVATIQATCEVLEVKYGRRLEEAAGTQAASNMGQEDASQTAGEITISRKEIEDMLQKVGSISAKAETINHIMGNVFQASMNELERIEVNPVEESTELIENYFHSLKNYGRIILDNSIPKCLVYMDKFRMEQVIDNIIGNSHKYAGTDIHVAFDEIKNPGNSFIRVRISDNGPGVDEDDLPLITEKYYRGKLAKDQSGYGIGMHLVKSYMEKQGGGVEYYNDNGFVVELLVKKV